MKPMQMMTSIFVAICISACGAASGDDRDENNGETSNTPVKPGPLPSSYEQGWYSPIAGGDVAYLPYSPEPASAERSLTECAVGVKPEQWQDIFRVENAIEPDQAFTRAPWLDVAPTPIVALSQVAGDVEAMGQSDSAYAGRLTINSFETETCGTMKVRGRCYVPEDDAACVGAVDGEVELTTDSDGLYQLVIPRPYSISPEVDEPGYSSDHPQDFPESTSIYSFRLSGEGTAYDGGRYYEFPDGIIDFSLEQSLYEEVIDDDRGMNNGTVSWGEFQYSRSEDPGFAVVYIEADGAGGERARVAIGRGSGVWATLPVQMP